MLSCPREHGCGLNMRIWKETIRRPRAIAGNQQAGQLKPPAKVTRVFKQPSRADAHVNSGAMRALYGLDILLWDRPMVARQQRSVHIKRNQLNLFHIHPPCFRPSEGAIDRKCPSVQVRQDAVCMEFHTSRPKLLFF